MSSSAMHVAQTGLTSQQYKLQVIANNLSNVNTTGFKRERANFQTQLYQTLSQSGGAEIRLGKTYIRKPRRAARPLRVPPVMKVLGSSNRAF